MCFADPPYFLSNGGFSCSSGQMVSVDKGEWDKHGSSIQDKLNFNLEWLRLVQAKLKPNGTIWISGTHHNIYSVGVALELLGYRVLNHITWYKTNAAPNLSCRFFTHSTESVIWASKNKKSKHVFNYPEMREENGGKQMRDVWTFPTTPKREKSEGKHPTQKPLALLDRIIRASTQPGDTILDPFNGSGTTGIAANRLGRKYIGIDTEVEFLEITKKRLISEA
jgi:site-specific DNA-methyltransferase (adenine-specific)